MLARNSFRPIGIGALVAVVSVCAGCGESAGPRRVALFGKVTLDGAPMGSGSISLLPRPNNDAPAAHATIQRGEYRFDRVNGPAAGEYEILIMHGASGGASSKAESFQSRGPQRQEWELAVNIPAAGEFEHDISLNSLKTAAAK